MRNLEFDMKSHRVDLRFAAATDAMISLTGPWFAYYVESQLLGGDDRLLNDAMFETLLRASRLSKDIDAELEWCRNNYLAPGEVWSDQERNFSS